MFFAMNEPRADLLHIITIMALCQYPMRSHMSPVTSVGVSELHWSDDLHVITRPSDPQHTRTRPTQETGGSCIKQFLHSVAYWLIFSTKIPPAPSTSLCSLLVSKQTPIL